MKVKVYIVVVSWNSNEEHYRQYNNIFSSEVDAYKKALEIASNGDGNKAEVLEEEIDVDVPTTLNIPEWKPGVREIKVGDNPNPYENPYHPTSPTITNPNPFGPPYTVTISNPLERIDTIFNGKVETSND